MGRDVGVDQLVQELERRGDRLPFEIGAFVALEACEGLLLESVRLDADDVRVTVDGSVVVSNEAERAEPDEAARSLVSVLARLLVAAGPGVPPHLLQLVKDGKTGHNPHDLRHLHDAIEASLIPINRGASRRVLARLVRESDRPPAPEPVRVDPRELDTELQELLRDPATRTLEPAHAGSRSEEWNAEEPITEQIRIPSALTREGDLHDQPETMPVPPSRPAVARSSASVPDLRPPSVPDTAAAVAELPKQPPQPGPEPITATIRKWSREEETESGSAPASVPVSASVPASVPVSVSVSLLAGWSEDTAFRMREARALRSPSPLRSERTLAPLISSSRSLHAPSLRDSASFDAPTAAWSAPFSPRRVATKPARKSSPSLCRFTPSIQTNGPSESTTRIARSSIVYVLPRPRLVRGAASAEVDAPPDTPVRSSATESSNPSCVRSAVTSMPRADTARTDLDPLKSAPSRLIRAST